MNAPVTKPASLADAHEYLGKLIGRRVGSPLRGLQIENRVLEIDMSHRLGAPSLADVLAPEHGIKAEALATAYDRFCQHQDRARFVAEVRAIQTCNMIREIGGLA